LEAYREKPDELGYSSGAAEDDEPDDEVSIFVILIYINLKIFKAQKAEIISTAPTAVKNHVEVDGKPKGKKSKYMGADSGSESGDESDWGSESDESSSASDLEPLEGKEMEELRRYFLK
jgi:hypothetical protein